MPMPLLPPTLPPMVALLLACALALPARAADDLDDLVEEALTANPDLQSRQARVDELRALEDVAGAWPDLMVGVEYSNVPVSTLSLADHRMAGLQLRVQQTTRPPSWSRLQRAVVDARAQGAEADLEEVEVQLRATVEVLYWQLTLTRQLEALTREHLDRTEELHAAVVARYEVGEAGQHAVLRLEVLRDRLADELLDFQRRDRTLSAALARTLARDVGRFDTPTSLEPLAPPEDMDTWLRQAEEQRPALEATRTDAAASRAAADLARVEGFPDLTVWAGYRVRTVQTDTDPGTDLASVGLSVPIPLGSGRRARGARAAHLHAAAGADARLEADLDQLRSELVSTQAEWERAHAKATTYADVLLPEARAALETTSTDFAVGKADFSSLYDAEVTLLDLERALLTAVAQTHLSQARAQALVGSSTAE